MTQPPDQLRKLLEHHLNASGMSQTALARQMKIAPSAVSRILSGERQISAIELFAIRDIFNIPFKEFEKIFSVGIRDDVELITASYYHESSNILSHNRLVEHLVRDDDIIACANNLVDKFSGGYDNQVRWFEIVDDAMSPTIMKGDIVFVDTRDVSGSGVYLLRFGNDAFSPRRIDSGRWENDELMIYVSADNSRYRSFHAPLEDLQIKGRIAGRMTIHV